MIINTVASGGGDEDSHVNIYIDSSYLCFNNTTNPKFTNNGDYKTGKLRYYYNCYTLSNDALSSTIVNVAPYVSQNTYSGIENANIIYANRVTSGSLSPGQSSGTIYGKKFEIYNPSYASAPSSSRTYVYLSQQNLNLPSLWNVSGIYYSDKPVRIHFKACLNSEYIYSFSAPSAVDMPHIKGYIDVDGSNISSVTTDGVLHNVNQTDWFYLSNGSPPVFQYNLIESVELL